MTEKASSDQNNRVISRLARPVNRHIIASTDSVVSTDGVHTSSGAHLACFTMSSWVIAAGAWTWPLGVHVKSNLKIGGAISPFPFHALVSKAQGQRTSLCGILLFCVEATTECEYEAKKRSHFLGASLKMRHCCAGKFVACFVQLRLMTQVWPEQEMVTTSCRHGSVNVASFVKIASKELRYCYMAGWCCRIPFICAGVNRCTP